MCFRYTYICLQKVKDITKNVAKGNVQRSVIAKSSFNFWGVGGLWIFGIIFLFWWCLNFFCYPVFFSRFSSLFGVASFMWPSSLLGLSSIFDHTQVWHWLHFPEETFVLWPFILFAGDVLWGFFFVEVTSDEGPPHIFF